MMRNLTLTLPEELVKKAKVIAATRDTSISALVADYFAQLAGEHDDYDLVWAEEERLLREGLPMRVGAATWSRDEVHER